MPVNFQTPAVPADSIDQSSFMPYIADDYTKRYSVVTKPTAVQKSICV